MFPFQGFTIYEDSDAKKSRGPFEAQLLQDENSSSQPPAQVQQLPLKIEQGLNIVFWWQSLGKTVTLNGNLKGF